MEASELQLQRIRMRTDASGKHLPPIQAINLLSNALTSVSPHGATGVAVALSPFDRLALVVAMLATGESEFDLRSTAPKIDGQRDEGQPLLRNPTIQAIDLAAMEKELSATLGVRWIRPGCGFIGRDVELLKPGFPAVDRAEGVPKVGVARPQAFHFRAVELEPGFPGVHDFVVEARTTIRRDDEAPLGIESIRPLLLVRLGHGCGA
jgi:hypothetical protein